MSTRFPAVRELLESPEAEGLDANVANHEGLTALHQVRSSATCCGKLRLPLCASPAANWRASSQGLLPTARFVARIASVVRGSVLVPSRPLCCKRPPFRPASVPTRPASRGVRNARVSCYKTTQTSTLRCGLEGRMSQPGCRSRVAAWAQLDLGVCRISPRVRRHHCDGGRYPGAVVIEQTGTQRVAGAPNVQFLLTLPAARIQDFDWWTPLHAAAACGNWRIMNMLLSHGADVTAVNADGDLAFDIAEGKKSREILEKEHVKLGTCVPVTPVVWFDFSSFVPCAFCYSWATTRTSRARNPENARHHHPMCQGLTRLR